MRFFTKNFSSYYRDYTRVHSFSTPIEIIRGASLELAKAVVQLRAKSTIQIVGFDLAGAEYGYPASDHEESYELVQHGFICKTVHAGEAFGPESIFQAATKLQTDRIGHGLHLFDEDMIHSEEITDRSRYVANLVNYLADRRITLEVCLTSNMQTTPEIGALKNHSLRKMLENKLSVSFCTDNRLVSNTTVCNELRLALENFPITSHDLKNIIVYGFKRSFYYHSYPEKRAWVRRTINYYDAVAKKFGIPE
jgi:adenosine deaminase